MDTASKSTTQDETTFRQELDRLLQINNITNFLFIARAWLIILVAIGGFFAFDHWRIAAELNVLWDIPILLLAIVIVGASQHQLAGAGHEATHYILFRNRAMSELVSNWLCMFPILTSTAIYRKQHLAHHLHVNDPTQDPDLSQLKSSGHDFDFPIPAQQVVSLFLRQLWLPNLLRYTLHRARYSAVGTERAGKDPNTSLPSRLFFPYFFLLYGVLGLLAHFEFPVRSHLLAAALLAGGAAVTILVADQRSGPEPSTTTSQSLQRYAHATLLLLTLTLVHIYTDLETLTCFGLLWLLPLVTSFSYFMMLRQTIQHGNCDSGRFTNTRVFLVNPFTRYAVFPFGMDYHLPHHLYATVPHYHLPALHELLKANPDYQQPGVVVRGCFQSVHDKESITQAPSIVAALGADYSLKADDKTTHGESN